MQRDNLGWVGGGLCFCAYNMGLDKQWELINAEFNRNMPCHPLPKNSHDLLGGHNKLSSAITSPPTYTPFSLELPLLGLNLPYAPSISLLTASEFSSSLPSLRLFSSHCPLREPLLTRWRLGTRDFPLNFGSDSSLLVG